MIDQVGIAITGVTAIFLTQSKSENLRRYACLFGMAGQPFWIYSAVVAQQWGILVLTCFYTAAWAKGVWTHWISRKPPERHPMSGYGYAISESTQGSYRLIVRYDTLKQLQAAHGYLVSTEQELGR